MTWDYKVACGQIAHNAPVLKGLRSLRRLKPTASKNGLCRFLDLLWRGLIFPPGFGRALPDPLGRVLRVTLVRPATSLALAVGTQSDHPEKGCSLPINLFNSLLESLLFL